MARSAFTGFESGSPQIEGGSTVSGITFDATIFRTGARSLKVVAASGVATAQSVTSFGGTKYVRVYVRVTALPASGSRIIVGFVGVNQINIGIDSTGAVTYYINTTAQCTSATLLTDTTTWYCIQFTTDINAGLFINSEVMLVDSESCGCTSPIAGGAYMYLARVGASDTTANTYTIYFDDYAEDDTAWCDTGGCVLARPISDNSRGGWTAGAGATTNLFDAVDNVPPVGLAAASETNTSQIKNAVSSATDNCDFNLQSYTTAAVPSGAVVNAVRAVASHGEEISTGTKSGALKIVSNPAQAVEDTFIYGDDVGADGTYPTNWSTVTGSIQSGAGVTFGTSPVLRVGKRTATTRLVNVCFIGMYIDYTPGAIASGALMPSATQAVMRAANW